MRWVEAFVSFPPTPGSLEGWLFGLGGAFLALVGGSEGTSCGTHREKVAVLVVEGSVAV